MGQAPCYVGVGRSAAATVPSFQRSLPPATPGQRIYPSRGPSNAKKSLPGTRWRQGGSLHKRSRGGAGFVALIATKPALGIDLAAQCGYFRVSPPKIASEFCDQAEAFCKLAVEGCGLICKIAAGSGVGLGLRDKWRLCGRRCAAAAQYGQAQHAHP